MPRGRPRCPRGDRATGADDAEEGTPRFAHGRVGIGTGHSRNARSPAAPAPTGLHVGSSRRGRAPCALNAVSPSPGCATASQTIRVRWATCNLASGSPRNGSRDAPDGIAPDLSPSHGELGTATRCVPGPPRTTGANRISASRKGLTPGPCRSAPRPRSRCPGAPSATTRTEHARDARSPCHVDGRAGHPPRLHSTSPDHAPLAAGGHDVRLPCRLDARRRRRTSSPPALGRQRDLPAVHHLRPPRFEGRLGIRCGGPARTDATRSADARRFAGRSGGPLVEPWQASLRARGPMGATFARRSTPRG